MERKHGRTICNACRVSGSPVTESKEIIMTIFFSDLDNTAIYSYHHIIENPIVWVEYLHGRKQSFMTRKYYEYFMHQTWLSVVPITTRSYEQYKRLKNIADELRWKDALICNGAVLLRDGVEDIAWREESILISQADQPYFQALYDIALQLYSYENIIYIPKIMFYIKTGEPDKTFDLMCEFAALEHICVYKDSRKVYCLPTSLSKGNATKRYMKMKKETAFIAAGDSEFDISMLAQADICLCPEKISNQIKESGKKVTCREIFSDAICDEMKKLRNEGNFDD